MFNRSLQIVFYQFLIGIADRYLDKEIAGRMARRLAKQATEHVVRSSTHSRFFGERAAVRCDGTTIDLHSAQMQPEDDAVVAGAVLVDYLKGYLEARREHEHVNMTQQQLADLDLTAVRVKFFARAQLQFSDITVRSTMFSTHGRKPSQGCDVVKVRPFVVAAPGNGAHGNAAIVEPVDDFWVARLIYMFAVPVPNQDKPVMMALVDWYTHAAGNTKLWRRYRETRASKKFIRFILLSDIECRCYFIPDTRQVPFHVWKKLSPEQKWSTIVFAHN